MTDPPAIWQISAGPADRSYADVFLTYGVGLIGPGDSGPWKPSEKDERFEGGFVRRFASEMQVGDVIVLRTGIDRIRAVGVVASDYQYLDPFDDVNGWDLQHARRIRWHRLPEEYVFSGGVFGSNATRCSRVLNEEVKDYARRFVGSGLTRWQEAPLPALPPVDAPLEKVPRELGDVVALVRDLAGLYGDAERLGDPPRENETVAHFVVPFLRALGWAPERIAVEWRRIDVALFDALPRTPESCRFVIEAKRLGTGLEGARKQAKAYVEMLGVPPRGGRHRWLPIPYVLMRGGLRAGRVREPRPSQRIRDRSLHPFAKTLRRNANGPRTLVQSRYTAQRGARGSLLQPRRVCDPLGAGDCRVGS